MVEFALVLPLLLVLLLGIADFGRVFAAGITVESAARTAAEATALEYLRNPPAPFPSPAPVPPDASYYADLHRLAAQTACEEVRPLPNAEYDVNSRTCDGLVILVCVHDSADPACGDPPAGFPDPAAQPSCTQMDPAPEPLQEAEAPDLRYVEVRLCYRFTTLFNLTNIQLPFGAGLSLGDVYLQKNRTFTVADY
jgi:hypothetical protein